MLIVVAVKGVMWRSPRIGASVHRSFRMLGQVGRPSSTCLVLTLRPGGAGSPTKGGLAKLESSNFRAVPPAVPDVSTLSPLLQTFSLPSFHP